MQLVWVSSNPYQLGAFVAYDLNMVFKEASKNLSGASLHKASLTIEADPFLYSEAYKHYEQNRNLSRELSKAIANKEYVSPKKLKEFQQTNPDFWEVYYLIGRYHYEKKYYKAALNAFEIAKTKEITTVPDSKEIDLYIKKIKRRLNE